MTYASPCTVNAEPKAPWWFSMKRVQRNTLQPFVTWPCHGSSFSKSHGKATTRAMLLPRTTRSLRFKNGSASCKIHVGRTQFQNFPLRQSTKECSYAVFPVFLYSYLLCQYGVQSMFRTRVKNQKAQQDSEHCVLAQDAWEMCVRR